MCIRDRFCTLTVFSFVSGRDQIAITEGRKYIAFRIMEIASAARTGTRRVPVISNAASAKYSLEMNPANSGTPCLLYTSQPAFMQEVLGCEAKRTAAEEKKTFHGILKDVISEEVEDAKTVILDIQQDLNDMVEEHKNVFENEPVLLTPPAIREAMAEKGLSEEVISKVEEICEEAFGCV